MLDPALTATLGAMSSAPKPVASPCTLVCTMNAVTGLCYGCHRTVEEIAGWRAYTDAQRAAIMAQLKGREKSAD